MGNSSETRRAAAGIPPDRIAATAPARFLRDPGSAADCGPGRPKPAPKSPAMVLPRGGDPRPRPTHDRQITPAASGQNRIFAFKISHRGPGV